MEGKGATCFLALDPKTVADATGFVREERFCGQSTGRANGARRRAFPWSRHLRRGYGKCEPARRREVKSSIQVRDKKENVL